MRSIWVMVMVMGLAGVASGESWTIGNTRVERVVSFSTTAGLTTDRLTNLDTHQDLIRSSEAAQRYAPEFSFAVDGVTVNGTGGGWRLVKGEVLPVAGGRELTVTMASTKLPMTVEVRYRVYEGQPAVRKWLVLRNTGAATVAVTHLKMESIAPSLGATNELGLKALYGSAPRELLYTGRSEDAALLVANERTGDGIAVLNEAPGYMKRTEIDGYYHSGRVMANAMYDTDLMPFERRIGPGERFETAAVSLVVYRVGAGVLDPKWAVPGYSAAVLERRLGSRGAPWIYNTWNPFERKINQATTMQLVDAAGAMGLDIFTIDDGWQKEYGENEVNLEAFPGGLDPVVKAVEAKGMRLGLWVPLAAIGEGTAEAKAHPEWAARDMEGKVKTTGTAAGTKVVMCMASPFRDSAAERVNDAIERFHLAYVKLDLTTVFNAYGEAPGCWAKGHLHGSWAESLGMIYEGIRHVTAKVYAKHPDVLLDLTFELWGQKHVIDGGLLAAGDLDWLSNVNDDDATSSGPRQARMLLYQRAASMPPDAMLIGNLQAGIPNKEEVFATAAGAAPVVLGDLRTLSVADRAWYREHIRMYKELRARANITQGFFPLGSWEQPSVVRWDGFARMAHTGDGMVVLFRNEAKEDAAVVRLPLLPKGRFRVRSWMTGKEQVVTSEGLGQGLTVRFEGAAAKVEMLEIRAGG